MMRPAWTAPGSGPNISSRNASRLLQPLGVERLANAVAPEVFDHIAAGIPENMEIAGMRIAPERLLHLQRQSFHAAAHVGMARRQPDPHTGWEGDHRRSSASSTSRSAAPFTPLPTPTR